MDVFAGKGWAIKSLEDCRVSGATGFSLLMTL